MSGVDDSGKPVSVSSSTAGSTQSSAGPRKGPSVCAAVEATDIDERRRAAKSQKRKARKVQWRQRKRERQLSAVREMEKEEEEDDDDGFDDGLDDGMDELTQEVPVQLVMPIEANTEYIGRLSAALQSGGVMSIGTYRKLMTLMEADEAAAVGSGRAEKDWKAAISSIPRVVVHLVVSDADLPYDERDEWQNAVSVNE